MNKPKRKIFQVGLGLIVLIVILFISVHFPQLYIKKSFDYRSFSVFSNDKLQAFPEVQATLDSVASLLSKSSFYQKEQNHNIFFTRGSFYEKLVRMAGLKNMAFSFFDHQILAAHPDFISGQLYRNNNDREVMDLIQVITHEAVHNQMSAQHSFLGRPTTPAWINEGYCEYIAYSSVRQSEGYKLINLVKHLEQNPDDFWMKTEFEVWTPRTYIRDRAVIEFLIDEKGRSIKQIIEDEFLNPEAIYQELLKSYQM